MTEVAVASKVPVKDERPGTIGQLLPNVTAKVVDVETGALLPPLADGEICIKTPSVCAATWGGEALLLEKETLLRYHYYHHLYQNNCCSLYYCYFDYYYYYNHYHTITTTWKTRSSVTEYKSVRKIFKIKIYDKENMTSHDPVS